MDPRKIKIDDSVLIYHGKLRISAAWGVARFLLGPNARGKVTGVGPVRGREGSETQVYVELENGTRGAFRAVDVHLRKSG